MRSTARKISSKSAAVIVYQVLGQTVEITNIFHSGRDYAALYRGGKLDEDG